MTKRFERIEAAIAQVTSDIDCTAGQEIRVALQDASEPERDALVKPLTALLRHWRGMERQDSRWWPQRQLAEITLVACEPDSPAMRRRLTLHSDDERLFTMIADRRPAWMTVVMQELFATKLPSDLLEDRNWVTAERLRHILGASRPLDERNVVALGVHLSQHVPMEPVRELGDGVLTSPMRILESPAAVLRNDPDAEAIALAILHSPQLARISILWATKDEMRENGWPRAIAELTNEGVIDRDRALDACFEALEEEASMSTIIQRLLTLELLAPTAADIEYRRTQLKRLATSPRRNIAKYAAGLVE